MLRFKERRENRWLTILKYDNEKVSRATATETIPARSCGDTGHGV